jgi:hypothetical protein
MANSKQVPRQAILLVGLFLLFPPPLVHATVYGWKGEGGVLNLSNDPNDVPETQRASAKQFTSKLAGRPVAEDTAVAVTPPSAETASVSAYERGLERGLLTAERQIDMVGELARTVLSAAPQPSPPPTVIIQQPSPSMVVRYVSPDYYSPYYGTIGPYSPYWGWPYGFGYTYGFSRGRFVPHSHFFPVVRGRRSGIFFPQGHFSHHGFLFGSGLVVR